MYWHLKDLTSAELIQLNTYGSGMTISAETSALSSSKLSIEKK